MEWRFDGWRLWTCGQASISWVCVLFQWCVTMMAMSMCGNGVAVWWLGALNLWPSQYFMKEYQRNLSSSFCLKIGTTFVSIKAYYDNLVFATWKHTLSEYIMQMLIWDIWLRYVIILLFYQTVPFLKFFKYYCDMQIMFKVVKSSFNEDFNSTSDWVWHQRIHSMGILFNSLRIHLSVKTNKSFWVEYHMAIVIVVPLEYQQGVASKNKFTVSLIKLFLYPSFCVNKQKFSVLPGSDTKILG